MTPESVSLLWFSVLRVLRYQIRAVWFFTPGETFECAFTVYVFNGNSGSVRINGFYTALIDVRPKLQRESARETTSRGRKIVCDARQIERQIECNEKAASFVSRAVQRVDKFATREQSQFFVDRVRLLSFYVIYEN